MVSVGDVHEEEEERLGQGYAFDKDGYGRGDSSFEAIEEDYQCTIAQGEWSEVMQTGNTKSYEDIFSPRLSNHGGCFGWLGRRIVDARMKEVEENVLL